MVAQRRVTLRAQWLGERLKQLREDAAVKQSEAANYLDKDVSGLSRIESGLTPIREPDLKALLELYSVAPDDPRYRDLLSLRDDAQRADWWDGYAQDVEGSMIDYVWLESRATEIRSFRIFNVEGLLQTPEYARSLIEASSPDASEEQLDRWHDLRMKRQTVLTRRNPLRLSVILDEAVLRRPIGGRDVTAAQLRHLVSQAGRPHIEVRVLPFEVGTHPAQEGEFRYFTLPDPFDEVVCVECQAGQLYLEPPRSSRFVGLYDALLESALGPDESVEFIATAAEQLEKP